MSVDYMHDDAAPAAAASSSSSSKRTLEAAFDAACRERTSKGWKELEQAAVAAGNTAAATGVDRPEAFRRAFFASLEASHAFTHKEYHQTLPLGLVDSIREYRRDDERGYPHRYGEWSADGIAPTLVQISADVHALSFYHNDVDRFSAAMDLLLRLRAPEGGLPVVREEGFDHTKLTAEALAYAVGRMDEAVYASVLAGATRPAHKWFRERLLAMRAPAAPAAAAAAAASSSSSSAVVDVDAEWDATCRRMTDGKSWGEIRAAAKKKAERTYRNIEGGGAVAYRTAFFDYINDTYPDLFEEEIASADDDGLNSDEWLLPSELAKRLMGDYAPVSSEEHMVQSDESHYEMTFHRYGSSPMFKGAWPPRPQIDADAGALFFVDGMEAITQFLAGCDADALAPDATLDRRWIRPDRQALAYAIQALSDSKRMFFARNAAEYKRGETESTGQRVDRYLAMMSPASAAAAGSSSYPPRAAAAADMDE